MKILIIANSFGQDAARYLHQIGRTVGKTLDVTMLMIGGCPLDRHYRNMLSDQQEYGLEFNGRSTSFRVSLSEALLCTAYDVVTIQQASPKSPKPETYQPYARELYDYVRQCQPDAKILIHQTWAYNPAGEKLYKMGFESHEDMFGKVEKAYQKCHEELGTAGIIPSGKMMATLLERGIKCIHRDDMHASKGLGRYALGLLWLRMLTGKSVAEIVFNDFDEPIPEEEIRIAKEVVDSFPPLEL